MYMYVFLYVVQVGTTMEDICNYQHSQFSRYNGNKTSHKFCADKENTRARRNCMCELHTTPWASITSSLQALGVSQHCNIAEGTRT